MKVLKVVAALALSLAAVGCSASSTLMKRDGQRGPDTDVVKSFVCRGATDQATTYLESLNLPLSDRLAILEKARNSCPASK